MGKELFLVGIMGELINCSPRSRLVIEGGREREEREERGKEGKEGKEKWRES